MKPMLVCNFAMLRKSTLDKDEHLALDFYILVVSFV